MSSDETLDSLRAEVKRLRAVKGGENLDRMLTDARDAWFGEQRKRQAAESHLAAATELLRDVVEVHGDDINLNGIRAFLANQPAAPTRFAYVAGVDLDRDERLRAKGFEPVTESSGGYTVGDALGLPRQPERR